MFDRVFQALAAESTATGTVIIDSTLLRCMVRPGPDRQICRRCPGRPQPREPGREAPRRCRGYRKVCIHNYGKENQRHPGWLRFSTHGFFPRALGGRACIRSQERAVANCNSGQGVAFQRVCGAWRVRASAVGTPSGACGKLASLVWSAKGPGNRERSSCNFHAFQGVTGTGGSGGGGNRTRVRKPSATASTCLSGENGFASSQPPQPGKEDASLD